MRTLTELSEFIANVSEHITEPEKEVSLTLPVEDWFVVASAIGRVQDALEVSGLTETDYQIGVEAKIIKEWSKPIIK